MEEHIQRTRWLGRGMRSVAVRLHIFRGPGTTGHSRGEGDSSAGGGLGIPGLARLHCQSSSTRQPLGSPPAMFSSSRPEVAGIDSPREIPLLPPATPPPPPPPPRLLHPRVAPPLSPPPPPIVAARAASIQRPANRPDLQQPGLSRARRSARLGRPLGSGLAGVRSNSRFEGTGHDIHQRERAGEHLWPLQQGAAAQGEKVRQVADPRPRGIPRPPVAGREYAGDRQGVLPVPPALRGELAGDPRRDRGDPPAPRGGAAVPGGLARPDEDFQGRQLAHLHPVRLRRQAREELPPGAGDDAPARTGAQPPDRVVLHHGARLSHPGAPRRLQGHPALSSGPADPAAARAVPDAGRPGDHAPGRRASCSSSTTASSTRCGTTPTRNG